MNPALGSFVFTALPDHYLDYLLN